MLALAESLATAADIADVVGDAARSLRGKPASEEGLP
jgi:hypothetical protein